jgi:hypothetical protein
MYNGELMAVTLLETERSYQIEQDENGFFLDNKNKRIFDNYLEDDWYLILDWMEQED